MIDLKIRGLMIDPGFQGWTLCRKANTKDKETGEIKEKIINLSYHGTLAAAIAEAWRVTQRETLSGFNCDLDTALRIMQDIQNEFRCLLAGVLTPELGKKEENEKK